MALELKEQSVTLVCTLSGTICPSPDSIKRIAVPAKSRERSRQNNYWSVLMDVSSFDGKASFRHPLCVKPFFLARLRQTQPGVAHTPAGRLFSALTRAVSLNGKGD
jgi:hypothetical protein